MPDGDVRLPIAPEVHAVDVVLAQVHGVVKVVVVDVPVVASARVARHEDRVAPPPELAVVDFRVPGGGADSGLDAGSRSAGEVAVGDAGVRHPGSDVKDCLVVGDKPAAPILHWAVRVVVDGNRPRGGPGVVEIHALDQQGAVLLQVNPGRPVAIADREPARVHIHRGKAGDRVTAGARAGGGGVREAPGGGGPGGGGVREGPGGGAGARGEQRAQAAQQPGAPRRPDKAPP